MPKKGEIDLRKERYWKAVISDFEKSGLSGRAYCRDKGISYTAFATRRRRLTNSTDVGSKPGSTHRVDFAPVALKSSPQEPSFSSQVEPLEIVFPTGVTVRVPGGYSVTALAEIVSILEV